MRTWRHINVLHNTLNPNISIRFWKACGLMAYCYWWTNQCTINHVTSKSKQDWCNISIVSGLSNICTNLFSLSVSQSAAAAPSPVMGNMPPNDGMPGGPMPPGFFQVSTAGFILFLAFFSIHHPVTPALHLFIHSFTLSRSVCAWAAGGSVCGCGRLDSSLELCCLCEIILNFCFFSTQYYSSQVRWRLRALSVSGK